MAEMKSFEVILRCEPQAYQASNGGEVCFQAKAIGELVRCRECIYYLNSNEKCGLIDTRLHFYETDNVWTEDCFCSWGERKGGDE